MLALRSTTPLQAKGEHKHENRKHGGKQTAELSKEPGPNHRSIGTQQNLWTLDPSSPGSPLFLPDGTHIFQKLVSFLRAQYPAFGFQEVLTPTLYKTSLWEQSGHWENYKNDMFAVHGSTTKPPQTLPPVFKDGRLQPGQLLPPEPVETYGVKPMNCPGHCLLFASQQISFRDLPIRYADFSPLHRDEVSGALSGLTRVRRFHQDDGHVFCRPRQVEEEIRKSLEFTKLVYDTFRLNQYAFVLSTRPKDDYIGTADEWDRAESQLEKALDDTVGKEGWSLRTGDGAFYGPKIDMILQDKEGRSHQTATIQLDFQLPKRFNLTYQAPAAEVQEGGEEKRDPITVKLRTSRSSYATPVMIHRAIFGSLERFMALLIEHHNGRWPFWLSPNQVIILTITDHPDVQRYAKEVQKALAEPQGNQLPRALNNNTYSVELDNSDMTLNRKIAKVKQSKKHNVVVVIGEKNVKRREVDVDVANMLDQRKVWDAIGSARPGAQAPHKKDTGTGLHVKGHPGARLSVRELQRAMQKWTDNYI